MSRQAIRIWFVPLVVVVSLVAVGTALAQTPDWCIGRMSPEGSPLPFGCAEIAVKPDGSLANFYEGDVLLATGQNPGRLSLSPGSHKITVRITQSPEPGFGTLFTYKDAVASLTVAENSVRAATVTPQKQYIRGTLSLTCDIRNATAADGLSCQVSIDGTVQPDLIAPGAKKDYILDPGSRSVLVTVVGTNAARWTPASQTKAVTISKGATASYKPRFDKMGHVVVTLDQPGVVGDFYVDNVLAATQVASYDGWVTPGKTHRIDVKNLTDPAAAGQWTWKNATTTVYLNPGQEKSIKLALQKQWLVGYIELTCTVTNYQPGQNIYCVPVLDGVAQANLPPGSIAKYAVSPGQHKVEVTLGPSADVQAAQPFSKTVSVQAGKIVKLNAQLTAQIPTFDVTLVNNTYTPVCNVFVAAAGSGQWGSDLLTGEIARGASKVFRVQKGNWDLYAQNCKGNPLDIRTNIAITAAYAWDVAGPVVTTGGPVTVNILNLSPDSVCKVLFWPSSGPANEWNWLGPDQKIDTNQDWDFLLTQGAWNMRIHMCGGGVMTFNNWVITQDTGLFISSLVNNFELMPR